jgi:hypothetical protein
LLIPSDADWLCGLVTDPCCITKVQFCFSYLYKCRTSKAKVLKIIRVDEYMDPYEYKSVNKCINNEFNFTYEVGKIVKPDSFTKSWGVCAHGIHFFMTLQQACDWGDICCNGTLKRLLK